MSATRTLWKRFKCAPNYSADSAPAADPFQVAPRACGTNPTMAEVDAMEFDLELQKAQGPAFATSVTGGTVDVYVHIPIIVPGLVIDSKTFTVHRWAVLPDTNATL